MLGQIGSPPSSLLSLLFIRVTGQVSRIIFYSAVTILFLSCHSVPSGQSGNPFQSSLTERQIGSSNYYISLPPAYSLKMTRGPDFDVYYFAPADTTAISNFSGGIYFGNFPNAFPPDNDSCRTETIRGKILGDIKGWTLYSCKGILSVQVIIDSKSNEGWNQRIHAFGQANSRNDLDNLMIIFSTLKHK